MGLVGWVTSGRHRTTLLLSLAFILAHADEMLLPGVYREIALVLHVSPVGLGTLTFIRSFFQSTCSPFAAYAAVNHNRVSVIALGAILWALATYAAGLSTSYEQIAFSRALNGVGLSLAFPAIHSLVADSTEEHERGFAFGILQATGWVGGILGGFCAIFLAGIPEILGVPGWRMAFHLVGTFSVVVALLVYFFAVDPRFVDRKTPSGVERKYVWGLVTGFRDDMVVMFREAKEILQIPSFQVIIGQGVPGTVPRKTLNFMPMWLELIGYSHKTTAVLMGLYSAGNIFGSIFGGRAGDALSRRFPDAGRIMLAQSGQVFGLIFVVILFVIFQDNPNAQIAYGGILFFFAFTTCWEAPGTNNPIFAEIVPEKARTSVYALHSLLESTTASFATPLVGLLAEKIYGFRLTSKSDVDGQNAVALAKAIYVTYSIPMLVACAIYSFLYCTYPRDRDEARAASKLQTYSPLTESQVQLEVLTSASNGLVPSSDDADDFDEELEVSVHK